MSDNDKYMESLMKYVKEEWQTQKVNSVREDNRKADVEYYYFSSFADSVGNGSVLLLCYLIAGALMYLIPEIFNCDDIFYDGGDIVTIVGICLFTIGCCIMHKFIWGELERIRIYRVDKDDIKIFYCTDSKNVETLPVGKEFRLNNSEINRSGVAKVQFNGKYGFINIDELTDVTVYSKDNPGIKDD